jgi:hypothetical protein
LSGLLRALSASIRTFAVLALVACSPGYSILSTKTPGFSTLQALHIISDVGARGDGEAKEFKHEFFRGLTRCQVQVQISMTQLFEINPEVHLRAAREAGAKHLLTIFHVGGFASVSAASRAAYEANLYDVGDGQVKWRANIETAVFGAFLAHALYNRLAQDQVVPKTCFSRSVLSPLHGRQ